MDYWLIQIINGTSFAMVLFLLAAGLSLIFGLMRIINLAHGCFYLWGAYVSLTIIENTENYSLALICGLASGAFIGFIIYRCFLYHFQRNPLSQVLLTIGFVFILGDLALYIWGGEPRMLPKPQVFGGSITLGDFMFPFYRLIAIAFGILTALGLWYLQDKTKIGILVRAAVDDPDMARASGVNVSTLFTGIFVLGGILSAFGGIVGGTLIGVYPGAEWEILLLALAVLIIGGLGSLKGAFVGSLFVGLIDTFGKLFFPQIALLCIFAPLAIVLAFKPSGFFGRSL